jgi:L-ascorbate metabolism protein UlaG (beta-lactamase superfamily)
MDMTRRNFILKLLTTLKGWMILSLMPGLASTAVSADSDKDLLHYTPLNGRSLRDMARAGDHHGSDGFVNPLGPGRQGRFWQLLKWKLSPNRFKKFFDDERVTPVAIDWGPVKNHPGISVTFLKHASLVINDGGRFIMVDPVYSEIFWFIKDFSPLQFDPRTIPEPQHVLITHGHYDHLDTASLAYLKKDTHIVTPLGYDHHFSELEMTNRTQLDWYNKYRDGDLEITLLPCNHWTMRNPITGPNRSLWGSYLIRTAGGYTIYISGDTAYFDGFEQLGREYDIDLAVFNVGAYEPRWFMAQSHIDPRETVQAFKELNARKLLVVHWGTFRLGNEPVHFPPLQVKEELGKDGLLDRLVDLTHGQTLFV